MCIPINIATNYIPNAPVWVLVEGFRKRNWWSFKSTKFFTKGCKRCIEHLAMVHQVFGYVYVEYLNSLEWSLVKSGNHPFHASITYNRPLKLCWTPTCSAVCNLRSFLLDGHFSISFIVQSYHCQNIHFFKLNYQTGKFSWFHLITNLFFLSNLLEASCKTII